MTADIALIVHGGWEGHHPTELAAHFRGWLEDAGMAVEMRDSLDAFTSLDLAGFRLIVPIWTMGEITPPQRDAVRDAVAAGVGLAGCHGGMCDAFRSDPDWQFLTGGQWVAHPGNDGVLYRVNVGETGGHMPHWITQDIADFTVTTEQYYLHVDPAVRILASTVVPPPEMPDDEATRRSHPGLFGPHLSNGPVRMPVAWVKSWGEGRVFYNALGHHPEVFDSPASRDLMRRGLVWAAQCEALLSEPAEVRS